MSVSTITFGDVEERMQKIGKLPDRGYSVDQLRAIGERLAKKGVGAEFVYMTTDGAKEAGVLVIRRGVQHILGTDTSALKAEHAALEVGKHVCGNLCFDEEPAYEAKGRIVAYRHIPLTARIRQTIAEWTDDEPLRGEANYDLTKCGIGYHGEERRKVFAFRLGASERIPLYFQWFQESKPLGDRIKIDLGDGDMYAMSEKAVGFDWRKNKVPTLRHATGVDKCTISG